MKYNTESSFFLKVSVITVVYNNISEIQKTIDSITSQTYKNIEFIIVDGGSNDGTVEIIMNNNSDIDWWCSEKDGGIYDAMNKGVRNSTGDYIIFMNAGDTFYNSNSIETVMSQPAISDYDIIYGDYYVHNARRRNGYRKAKKIVTLWKGMPTSHQAMIFKRKSLIPIFYDTNSGLAADHKLLVEKYIAGEKFLMLLNITIANYSGGGVSDCKRSEIYSSIYKNSRLTKKNIFLLKFYFALMQIRTYLRMLIIKYFT
ncbi:TPA: glycosyltransferase family 2 protein [Yersinia enterocolitica]|uniref:glycosyltransferase family 2 protein n=1 Tax=Yersinia enterocolitica TaxID=630 RepID=UPI002AC4209A|nr:glycosyltransferase [Yersinia enterocolitica]